MNISALRYKIMIHTNDPSHRVKMLKMGYSSEDIRHAHIHEMYGYVVFIEVKWCAHPGQQK